MRFRVNMKIAVDALVGGKAGQEIDLLLFLLGFFRGGLLRRLCRLRFLGHEPSVNPVKQINQRADLGIGMHRQNSSIDLLD